MSRISKGMSTTHVNNTCCGTTKTELKRLSLCRVGCYVRCYPNCAFHARAPPCVHTLLDIQRPAKAAQMMMMINR